MAIKFKISKSAYEKLSEDIKEAYKADGDNYIVDATGMPEPEGAPELKRALERAKAELDDMKDDLKNVTTERDEIKKTMGEGDRDVNRLSKRHEQKLKDQQAEYEGKISAKDKIILDGEIDRAADKLANKISTSPAVIKPHIIGRLAAGFAEDGTTVKLTVNKDGKPSDLSLDKLGEEFVANKEFAAIIRASNATGGRAPSAPSGNPALPGNGQQPPTNLAAMSHEDRHAAIKAKVEARQQA